MARTALEKLAAVSPDIADGFSGLRHSLVHGGPLPEETVELVVVGSLVATGQLPALRVHVRRLLRAGTDMAAIRHAVVVPLGAAATLSDTIEALDAVDALAAEPRP